MSDEEAPAGAPITTGSGLERSDACRASNVLPKTWFGDTVYSGRGVARHEYLARISDGMTPEVSLALVDEEHQAYCEGMDLGGLQLAQLSAEVTLVIDLPTGAARILGRNLDRDYEGVGPDEVPMTIDLAGVDLQARRGAVQDHKTGWSRRTPARDNWQIKGAATALAAVYDLDEVDGALLLHRDGRPPYIDRAVFTAADFLIARGELRELHRRTLSDRAAYARGEHIESTEGPYCTYCPCRWDCPAKIGLLRNALAIGTGDRAPVTVADAGQALDMIAAAKKALHALESSIYALAAQEPGGLLLRVDEDGTEHRLGAHSREGNEVIDGAIAIDVAAEILKVPPAELAAFQRKLAPPDTVTKKALHAAVKERAKALVKKIGDTDEEILKAIRARPGGAKNPIKTDVTRYTVRPSGPATEGP